MFVLNILIFVFIAAEFFCLIQLLFINSNYRKYILLSIIYFLIIVVLLEVNFRFYGFLWVRDSIHLRDDISRYVSDPYLGWTTKKGEYLFSPFSKNKQNIRMTYWDNGIRATAFKYTPKLNQIVFLGCSFTEGYALSDEETFAWKIQSIYPKEEVLNFGVVGYGTYQSYLKLKQLLNKDKFDFNPRIIVYFFIEDHLNRNVASGKFTSNLIMNSFKYSQHDFIKEQYVFPYCLLDSKGNLIEKNLSFYDRLKYHQNLALIGWVEDVIYNFNAYFRQSRALEVYRRLVVEMKHEAARYGSKFLVVILDRGDNLGNKYNVNGVDVVDCHMDGYYMGKKGFSVEGEGHPNEFVNEYWTECISGKLKGYVDSI